MADSADAKGMSGRIRRLVVVASVVGLSIVSLVLLTMRADQKIRVTSAEIDAAWQRSGCIEPEIPNLESQHIPESEAPPPAELYPVRPPTSGPHFGRPVTPIGFQDDPVLEADAIQSMERGAVVIWFDPSKVNTEVVAQIRDWSERRNRAGFALGARGGAGIIVAPYPDGLASGKALALHAWFMPLHCDSFDITAADGFLARFFGTRGMAPDGNIAGYPSEALIMTDQAE